MELRLDALGGKSSAETAKAIIKTARGEKLTKAEQKAFDENPYSRRVVNEMTEADTSNTWYTAMMRNVVYPEQRESFTPDTSEAQQVLDRSAQTKDAVAAAVFPNRAAQQRTASEMIAANQQTNAAQSIIEEGLSQPEGSAAQTYASQLREKALEGETITEEETAELNWLLTAPLELEDVESISKPRGEALDLVSAEEYDKAQNLKKKHAQAIKDGLISEREIYDAIRDGENTEDIIRKNARKQLKKETEDISTETLNAMADYVAAGGKLTTAIETAKNISKEAENERREQSTDNGMGRESHVDTGEQAESVQESTGRVEENERTERGSQETRRKDIPKANRVSSREIGISSGTNAKTLTIDSNPTATAQRIMAAFEKAANGFVAVKGNIETQQGTVQGVTTADGKVIFRTDHRMYGQSEILLHECGHLYIRDASDMKKALKEACLESMSEKQLKELALKYGALWQGVMNESMTDEEFYDYALEEIYCDALAGIDRINARGASRLTEAVRGAFEEETGIDVDALLSGTETGETAVTTEKSKAEDLPTRNNGPPSEGEKYSYDYSKPFEEQVDDWISGKIPRNDTLVIGATPDIFKKVEFNALPMTINQSHVDYAINGSKNSDHHIGAALLKQLPKALKTPVAIIASKMKNSTSLVALLPFTHNGKTVVAPVHIDGYGVQNSVRIDSNAVTSIHGRSNAVTKLLTDAINEYNAGKTSLFYIDTAKAATLYSGARVTMPKMPSESNGFVASIRDESSPVKPKFNSVTETQQFKRWFGNSKVVNEDGTPKVVYHQTENDFTVFDIHREGAGTRDNGTPFGIFLKSSDRDIGLKGKKQMALYARIVNPLRAKNRSEFSKIMRAMSQEYDDIITQHEALDREYKRKTQQATKKLKDFIIDWRANNQGADSRSLYEVPEFNALYDAEDALADEWTVKADELSTKAKETMTETLESNGYDGVILENDEGSFGRSTDAYIALHPEQVKSATDNIGTFDANNLDIRFSIDEDLPINLQRVLDGTFDAKNNEVHIGTTSNFLTDVIGANGLDLYMPAEKAYRAMATEEKAIFDGKPTGKNINYHGLDVDGLVKILNASEQPIAAFAAAADESGKRENRIVLVTDVEAKGGLGVVIEEMDTTARSAGDKIKANKAITVYPKGNVSSAIQEAIADNRILYLDEKRSQAHLAVRKGSNYPTVARKADFAINIRDFWANVKWKNTGKAEYTSESTEETTPEWKKRLAELSEKNSAAESARRMGFLVLPNVLKRGIEIDHHDNHKGRSYDTVTIAAPVEINGKRGNMAVVVKRTKGNRYKVHRILSPEGNAFTLQKKANAVANTVGAFTDVSQATGGSAPAIDTAFENSISTANENINTVTSDIRFSVDDAEGLRVRASRMSVNTLRERLSRVEGMIRGYSVAELVDKVRTYMTTESGNCELADLLERTQAVKVPDKVALDVYEFKSEARSDRDANGKVTTAAEEKVKAYINSLALSEQQKSTLYYSFYKK